ncbi:hypothetical protein SDC9_118206 [bioreactor metagenome]|uniref:Wadjet protein JetD C-terminal domain-containing protein n=1 Tax=bioreactor metagenome TaxID=1076179 RepID=A0A645C7E0_9ZZZZ
MERNIILTRLLDKYEASKHLIQPGSSTRRVMLRIEKKELPEYRYETAVVRDAYNTAAQSLEREALVCLEWVKGRPVLDTISLHLEHIDSAYAAAGRVHPQERAGAVCALLEKALAGVTTLWIVLWSAQVRETALTTLRVPAYCKEDTEFLANLLLALSRYDELHGEPITMRAFSTLCFQNSKRFEWEFRDEFLRIARRYNEELASLCAQEESSVRDQLAFLGIYARPELYELSGLCTIQTKAGQLDLSPLFPYGAALPSTAVDDITGVGLERIEQVVFIENKTNYDAYLQTEITREQLVIYHGGFLSPQKQKLFKMLAASIPENVPAFFWADIDMGGFQMFTHLQSLVPKLTPMRMSGQDVERYHAYGLARDADYFSRLAQAFESGQFSLFGDAIQKILEYGITIEQEIFLAERADVG